MYMSDKQHAKRVLEHSVGMWVADATLLHLAWQKVGDFLTLRYHWSFSNHKVCTWIFKASPMSDGSSMSPQSRLNTVWYSPSDFGIFSVGLPAKPWLYNSQFKHRVLVVQQRRTFQWLDHCWKLQEPQHVLSETRLISWYLYLVACLTCNEDECLLLRDYKQEYPLFRWTLSNFQLNFPAFLITG